MRFSGNLLIDEISMDKIEESNKKASGLGWSMGFNINPYKYNQYVFIPYLNWLRVGTHVMKHGIGFNNFVHRSSPIGWESGNDCENIIIGAKIIRPNDIIIDFACKYEANGKNSILFSPYAPNDNYDLVPFPSGRVIYNTSLETKLSLKINYNLRFHFQTKHSIINEKNHNFNISLLYCFSNDF